ncbi:MAG: hypothetical protein WCG26_01130 [Chloroflexales bacterium]
MKRIKRALAQIKVAKEELRLALMSDLPVGSRIEYTRGKKVIVAFVHEHREFWSGDIRVRGATGAIYDIYADRIIRRID